MSEQTPPHDPARAEAIARAERILAHKPGVSSIAQSDGVEGLRLTAAARADAAGKLAAGAGSLLHASGTVAAPAHLTSATVKQLHQYAPDYQQGFAAVLNAGGTDLNREQKDILNDLVSELTKRPVIGKAAVYCLAGALSGLVLREAGLILHRDLLTKVGQWIQDAAVTAGSLFADNGISAIIATSDAAKTLLTATFPDQQTQITEAFGVGELALTLFNHPDLGNVINQSADILAAADKETHDV